MSTARLKAAAGRLALAGQAAVPVGGGRACRHTNDKPRPIGGRRGACGAWPGFETTRRAKLAARTASGRAGHAAAGDLSGQQAMQRAAAHRHTQRPGPPRQATRRPEICRGNRQRQTSDRATQQHEAARPHRGPGGSRIRPLGGSQRLFQRICVPAAPRRSQASTTRAAMPASADLPHVRGSYCFLMPTSPSILRTPS